MKQTFIITAETTQEELVAHCVANHTVMSGFGMTRDYNLSKWTWLVYRGFTIEVYWNNDRKMVKVPYSPNDPTWHSDKMCPTKATKCDPADKPYFYVELPAFELYKNEHSHNINDIRKAIDKAISNGEKYWGWTETDRTTHLIKRKK